MPQVAIKSIKEINCDSDRYDIQVDNVSNFFANNILVHNCRILTIIDKDSNTITQYTRNGKINNNFTNVTTSLLPLLQKIPVSIVLDGEMVSRSFQELMTQVNRKENVNTSDAKLALFDVIPLEDFKKGICNVSQQERHNMLVGLTPLLQEHTNGLVYVIPKMIVDLDTKEGQEAFRKFNNDTLSQGFEGVMIKSISASYQTKRSDAWLKLKPVATFDLTIIDMEEGGKGTKYEGMLGALVCEGIDNGKKIRSNVGSGLSDEQRKEMWENKDKLIGEIVEIKADTLTLSADQGEENVWSLRFPRFERFRGIEKGEKL